MASEMGSKIIILGDVNGQLKQVMTKLTSLHKKNTFDFAIVAGNLFAEDDDAVSELLAGRIEIPLPVYFTVTTTALPPRIIEKLDKDEELCPNLHFLGKRSTTKTSEGIKIVTLGGQHDAAIIGGTSQDKYLPFHTASDAKVLKGSNSADILLTTCWPASIRNGSKVPLVEGSVDPVGQEHIADLCAALKPRYHFSVSPSFYEREPFMNNSTPDLPDFRPLTRFISLAPHGNPAKQKALYAFTLPKEVDQNAVAPVGTTAIPFTTSRPNRKRVALDEDPYSRYSGHDRNGYGNKRYKGRRGDRQPPPGPSECFFCLSNPTLATHLISSIGEDAYLTTAKGPLTTSETNKLRGVEFPCHALIIPLTHAPTLASITDEDNAKAKTFAEMNRFKEALQKMVAERSDNKLGAVTYEISKGNGVHTHWQFLPMPISMLRENLVELAFRVEAQDNKYLDFAERDPGVGENEGDFFRVWIWTPPNDDFPEGKTKCLTMPIEEYSRFNLQFGRTAIAKLLGLEKRIQWRDCAQDEQEEKAEIELFKEAFKDFDFTL